MTVEQGVDGTGERGAVENPVPQHLRGNTGDERARNRAKIYFLDDRIIYYNITIKLQKFINFILQYYTMNGNQKTTVTCIRIHPEILKEAKLEAIQRGLKFGKFVETAILHELQRK
jgi:predicted DNA binding CopG/RHH family protein